MARPSKYPVELKKRAVAMVRELERELGRGNGSGDRLDGEKALSYRGDA